MNGLISTLNRTGVMLEDLTDLSRSFAWYAGGCGDEVLDIGCAYGVATIAALEQGANVLAVDMEQHHLDILSERITEETKQCLSIKQGLLPDIDFEDERFGAIHASRVIHFLSPNDIQKTIKKMFRWLKPGGKLFLITDTPYVGYWQSKFLTYEERKAEGDLWPGYIKDVATVFDSKEVDGAPSLINPLDPDTLCREVMAAGFSVERAEFIKNPSMSGSVKPGKEHAGVIAVKPIRFIRSVKPDVKPSVKLSDINHTRRFTNQKIPGQISLPKEKNPKTIISFDNVSICYEVQGHASPALVFVHGLGCNRTYWDKQVEYFSASHQIVTIDLPGHGDSGLNRDQWTIKAFGKDVVSVIEYLGLNSIILIGHSMGGPVIVEAASYLEKQLIGSVGVDTFHNLLMKPMTQQEIESVCERIKNYGKDSLQYIVDPKLKEYIETCRESLAPEIRDEAFKDMVVYMQTMNTNFHYPFILINSSQWLPTNIHSAKKCNVEVRLMDKVGHFCMMEDSETFNTLLSNAISEFQSGKEAKKMINLQPTSTISMKNINNSTVQQTIHSLNPLIQQPPESVDNPKDIDANKSFDTNESLEDICSELQESLARELFMTSDEIDKKIDFVSLGLDSIYAVTWVRKINSQYGLSLKATELYSYPTFNDLATFILKENKKSGGVKPVSLSPIPQKSSIILEKPQEKTDRSFVQNSVITKKINTNSVIADRISPKKHLEASCDRREKVAIIGMSGRFPKANNLSEYWNNIIQKRD
jgi:SAM-dependent methyltransferase/acyl carrier protein/predicted alpha/beta hydrolase family esterase